MYLESVIRVTFNPVSPGIVGVLARQSSEKELMYGKYTCGSCNLPPGGYQYKLNNFAQSTGGETTKRMPLLIILTDCQPQPLDIRGYNY